MAPFRFKQFNIHHDRSTMKVGTDAVLLGAWADTHGARRVLDIGTGCGVIALMLAQRTTEAHIDAIEPDLHSFEEATTNVQDSPWHERMVVLQASAQNHRGEDLYDLIVSNPPFFNKSLLPPAETRANARHTQTLSFDDLLVAVSRLLAPEGQLAIILPAIEGDAFRKTATLYGLTCHRSTRFYSRPGKPQERWLMEFSRHGVETEANSLVLHGEGDAWSDEYRKLTEGFYL